jgi:hypothetical protein
MPFMRPPYAYFGKLAAAGWPRVALLAIQGLRPTTGGRNIAVLDAARAQFNDNGGIAVFVRINRVPRRSHDSKYPSADTPAITAGDARQAITIARETLEAARRIIATGKLGLFR